MLWNEKKNIIRVAVVVLMIFQNVTTMLLLRYIRTRTKVEMFITTTQVALCEIVKFALSFFFLYLSLGDYGKFVETVKSEVFSSLRTCVLVSIPALLYVVQNNLFIIAVSNLDIGVTQVIYQIRILTTAAFFWLFFRKCFSLTQWVSIFVLFLGMIVSQSGNFSLKSREKNVVITASPMLGLLCILINSVLSGFSGVFIEKLMKINKQDIWVQNIFLAGFGTFFSLLGCLINDREKIASHGFLVGYDKYVYVTIFFQAVGGLLVAMVIKHADNIIKGFALSVSIMLTTILSIFAFGFLPDIMFAIGALLVCISLFLYSAFPPSAASVATNEDFIVVKN